MAKDNIINLADAKAKRKLSVSRISEEIVEAIAYHSHILISDFHVDLVASQYEYRSEVGEETVADGLIVHFNVPTNFLRVFDADIPDDTYSVPLGLMLDLYVATNVNLKLALTYQHEDDDEVDIKYLHTDAKTLLSVMDTKRYYLEKLINDEGISLAEAQNYLARQLRYNQSDEDIDFTLNVAWYVASELASPSVNGLHSYFVNDPDNYESIQENFQLMEVEELFEILSDKIPLISTIFADEGDFMLSTQQWIKRNQEKVTSDTKVAYANIINSRYDHSFFLAEQEYAKS